MNTFSLHTISIILVIYTFYSIIESVVVSSICCKIQSIVFSKAISKKNNISGTPSIISSDPLSDVKINLT